MKGNRRKRSRMMEGIEYRGEQWLQREKENKGQKWPAWQEAGAQLSIIFGNKWIWDLFAKSLSVNINATVCWQLLGLWELMMKAGMRNEWERFYILKLAEGLCLFAVDLGGKTHVSSKNWGSWNGVRSCEEERVTTRIKSHSVLRISDLSVWFFFLSEIVQSW